MHLRESSDIGSHNAFLFRCSMIRCMIWRMIGCTLCRSCRNRLLPDFLAECPMFILMHDPPNNHVIALRTVRVIAVCAILNDFIVLPADKNRITRTFFTGVERAVAEHTIKVFQPFMAREVLTISVFKISIGIFHFASPRVFFIFLVPKPNPYAPINTGI